MNKSLFVPREPVLTLTNDQLPTTAAMHGLPSSLPTIAVRGTERKIQVREVPAMESLDTTRRELKVAYAQIRCEPGFFEENVAAHIACIEEAYRRGCHMVQFPELSLTSYECHDLFHDSAFLRAQEAWRGEIRRATEKFPGLTVVVGGVDVDWSKRRPGDRPYSYNSLFVMRDGTDVETIHKKLLPTYSIFDEDRWFVAGDRTRIVEVNGVKVGFIICEDKWTDGYSRDPVQELIDAGAQFLSHSSASPEEDEKNSTRAKLVQRITDRHHVPFGGVNMVGCYDGYEGDVPFDGRGLVRSGDGRWLAMGTPFTEELLIIDPFRAAETEIVDLAPVEELYLSAITSIQDFFLRLEKVTGKRFNAVLGQSGGIDSGLVTALLCDALGPDRVYALSLPTDFNSTATKSDAREQALKLGVHFDEISIQPVYEAFLATMHDAVENDPTGDKRISQNLQARLRTAAIQAHAMRNNGIMINTGNKTERFTNNFTIYADSAGTIGPIADLDKDRVYEVARFVNKLHGREVIPESMIAREASAELAPHQVDAAVMGDKPEIVAPWVRILIEEGINDAVTAKSRLGSAVKPELIDRWFGGINSSEWKGRQMTPSTRASKRSAGFNRRIPINHGWRGQLPKVAE